MNSENSTIFHDSIIHPYEHIDNTDPKNKNDMTTISGPIPASARARPIGFLRLSFLIFFLVAGGPFGVEVSLGAAGPLLTFIGLLSLPFIWALPQALVTAEMSTLISGNGGYVIWVKEAFGDFTAWIIAINALLSNIFDLALYPTLFVEYFINMLILIGLVFNIYGMAIVSTLCMLSAIFIFLPFITEFIVEFDNIMDGKWNWLASPPLNEVDWSTYLAMIIWSYTGWDQMGCFAGEIKTSKNTFPLAIGFGLAMITFMYALPLFIAIQTHPDWSIFTDGALGSVAFDFAPYLGYWVTLACMISAFAMYFIIKYLSYPLRYTTNISTHSRALWGLAIRDLSYVDPATRVEFGDSPVFSNKVLPEFFAYEWVFFQTPVIALCFISIIVLVFMFFDFVFLVKMSILFKGVTLILEVSSFLRFRYKYNDRERLYRVPFGWIGACLFVIPTIFVVIFFSIIAPWDCWVFMGSVNLLGIPLYFGLVRFWKYKEGNSAESFSLSNLDKDEAETKELLNDTAPLL